MTTKAKRAVAGGTAKAPKVQTEFQKNYLADLKAMYFRLREAEPLLFGQMRNGDMLASNNWLTGIQQIRIIGNMLVKYGDPGAIKKTIKSEKGE
jgi:hypothetical protein